MCLRVEEINRERKHHSFWRQLAPLPLFSCSIQHETLRLNLPDIFPRWIGRPVGDMC